MLRLQAQPVVLTIMRAAHGQRVGMYRVLHQGEEAVLSQLGLPFILRALLAPTLVVGIVLLNEGLQLLYKRLAQVPAGRRILTILTSHRMTERSVC